MTSERATLANRRNAQASTGPRTPVGKARSGQNARKHGLSAVDSNPATAPEVARLAKLVAGEQADNAAILEAARVVVAEAQFQLQRVKRSKTALLRSGATVCDWETEQQGAPSIDVAEELLDHLESEDRYERRAFSRQKFAARRLNELISKR